jgi:hypothetical protein
MEITAAPTAQQAAVALAQAQATLTRPERATAAATRWAIPINFRARTESRKSRHNDRGAARFDIRNAPHVGAFSFAVGRAIGALTAFRTL